MIKSEKGLNLGLNGSQGTKFGTKTSEGLDLGLFSTKRTRSGPKRTKFPSLLYSLEP